MSIGIPTISWNTMPSYYTYIISISKVNALRYSVQDLFESYFFLEKLQKFHLILSTEVRFYSLLKHHLTGHDTFDSIRLCGNDVYKVEKLKKKDTSEP